DEVYADTSSELNLFNLYYGNIPAIVLTEYYVQDIEVYKAINILSQRSILGFAYINLPPRSAASKYPDSLRYNSDPIAGEEEAGRFELLSEGRDYLFHPETGYITFLFALHDQDIVAVAYKTQGQQGNLYYGEFSTDLIHNHDTVAVLKLVKPKFLQPLYKTAWKLKMKNIYQLNPNFGEATDIDLDIYLKKVDGTETNSINNVRLLELFGFDKLAENGAPVPDGKFDNRPGFTYEHRISEIIFPVLEPFGENIPQELTDYKYNWIYDTTKTFLSLPENYFIIKGKYQPTY
ncbi:MAG: hypothetical protein OQK77_13960, partial [Psychromonas sp.]|nr:hypothetical protein [Psychromonas sp.]